MLDFYCHEVALAVEIDGESHNRGDQPEFDAHRDEYLRRNGQRVLRIPAVEVLSDLDAALRHIVDFARGGSPLHQPSAGPPPLKGRN